MKNAEMIRAVRLYRETLLKDPYRPGYHFAIPDGDGRPGDPNGCFFANGRHHLMYLYRRDGAAFHWGHVSSADLLHWRHHQDALVKGELDEGCFSGGAFVDDDGTAYISFWIFNKGEQTAGRDAGIGIAWSRPPYERWERLPEVSIASTEWGILDMPQKDGAMARLGCADPSNIWKKDGMYYMQTGNLCVLNKYGRAEDSPAEMRGDWVELFSSADLRAWSHEGRFYQRRADNACTDESEDDMCPSFLPLPRSSKGGEPSEKYLQLFIAHNKGCQYYIGEYIENRFYPESHGRMSWVDNAFFAPEAYIDGHGRQIMFAWLLDNLPEDFELFGWSGVFSLPRTLWLGEDNALRIAPADEINALRMGCRRFDQLSAGDHLPLTRTDSCEINLIAGPGAAGKAGLALTGPEEGQEARIYYDAEIRQLVFDAARSGSPVRAVRESAPLFLAEGERLNLRIYVDKSVIEVFANERQAICRRVYRKNGAAPKIRIICENDSRIESIEAYEMMESMPY